VKRKKGCTTFISETARRKKRKKERGKIDGQLVSLFIRREGKKKTGWPLLLGKRVHPGVAAAALCRGKENRTLTCGEDHEALA